MEQDIDKLSREQYIKRIKELESQINKGDVKYSNLQIDDMAKEAIRLRKSIEVKSRELIEESESLKRINLEIDKSLFPDKYIQQTPVKKKKRFLRK